MSKREPAGTYPTPRHGWTCFHCGETFSIATNKCHQAALEAAHNALVDVMACKEVYFSILKHRAQEAA